MFWRWQHPVPPAIIKLASWQDSISTNFIAANDDKVGIITTIPGWMTTLTAACDDKVGIMLTQVSVYKKNVSATSDKKAGIMTTLRFHWTLRFQYKNDNL